MKSKISSTKGGFVPCCYFPSLTLLVDDNARFLQALGRFLGNEKISQAFSNPSAAIAFMEQCKQSEETGFLHTHLGMKEWDRDASMEAINIAISEIHRIVFRKDRFAEPSVVVVDYAMPNMNGYEFSQKLKESFFPVKIIMLTGEANEHTAVTAFNEGVIDKFIKKSESDCLEKVKEYIAELEIRYFQDISRVIMESFRARSNFILEDVAFINIFNKICEENHIIEYYLIEDSGSFMMLDKSGNIIRLIVKTEEDMRMLYELASDYKDISSEALRSLEERKCLVYFHDAESRLSRSKNWRFEEAELIKGRQNYYYSVIKGVDHYPLGTQDIVSCAQYLKTRKK